MTSSSALITCTLHALASLAPTTQTFASVRTIGEYKLAVPSFHGAAVVVLEAARSSIEAAIQGARRHGEAIEAATEARTDDGSADGLA